jgi:threonylcarbamoyladenosine tRNA methylthiotransferase MtaB
MKAAFHTLGCKVNQYETDALIGFFQKSGYEISSFDEKADVYVINTCTVTNLSDRKSRQMIRKAKKINPDSIVAVIGCYAQVSPEEVAAIEGVNIVLGTKDRLGLVNMINELQNENKPIKTVGDIMKNRIFEEMDIALPTDRSRAYIKIQEGCNQFCSYCIIPYARGPVRSRNPEKIFEEVKNLSLLGFKEIVITGIHIASYGKDLKNASLLDLLENINNIDGISRIRLGSLEPQLITTEFVKTISMLNKICPHFHVSLQSGSDNVLKAMNRKYSANFYEKATSYLKNYIPNAAITTDIIVGFPGETEKDFNDTCELAEKVGFADIHVFKFSPRKGTPAASFENQISGIIKEERSESLIKLQRKLRNDYLKRFINICMPVLIESKICDNEGLYEGLTPNYMSVKVKAKKCLIGEIVNINLIKIEGEQFLGELKLE